MKRCEAMAELHAPAWRCAPPLDRVNRFYAALGLREARCRSSFQKLRREARKRFGPDWDTIETAIERRADGDMSDDFYALKNRSLNLSLVLSNLYTGTAHRRYLAWLAAQELSPHRILDVGADNGLLSAFMALQYPQAEIVAIDPCAEAVACGRELASRLGLANLRCIVGSLPDLGSAAISGDFDLITSTLVFQDSGFFAASESELPFQLKMIPPQSLEIVELARHLSPRGRWISLERCATASVYTGWLKLLAGSSVEIDWSRSCRLDCSLPGAPDDLTLLSLHDTNDIPVLQEDHVRSLWLEARFARGEEIPGGGAWVFRDEIARILYATLGDKQIVAENESGHDRLEISVKGPFAFLYCTRGPEAAFLRWSVRTKLQRLQAELDSYRDR